jgi:hypothetical protein
VTLPKSSILFTFLPLSVNYNDGNVPDQIATYTINTANGDLSTARPYTNMPTTAVFSVLTTTAPSGKLLAVGGTKGLQLFSFTGTSQVTAKTGLLTTAEIDQVTWDNSNHLYAISYPSGKLYVFTVTSTGVTQAPVRPTPSRSPKG